MVRETFVVPFENLLCFLCSLNSSHYQPLQYPPFRHRSISEWDFSTFFSAIICPSLYSFSPSMILHSGLHTNTRLQSKSSNRKSSSRYNEPKRNLSATPTSQKLRFGDDLQREFWELERKRKEKLRMKRVRDKGKGDRFMNTPRVCCRHHRIL